MNVKIIGSLNNFEVQIVLFPYWEIREKEKRSYFIAGRNIILDSSKGSHLLILNKLDILA